jgi:phosphoribosyl-ATP pyrophosphohydrolase
MNELIKRSYDSIVNRGLITPETSTKDFMDKLKEEYNEVQVEWKRGIFKGKQNEPFYHELMDLVNVAFLLMKNHGIDCEKLFIEIIEKNEKRNRFIK